MKYVIKAITPVEDMVNKPTARCSGCTWHPNSLSTRYVTVKYNVPFCPTFARSMCSSRTIRCFLKLARPLITLLSSCVRGSSVSSTEFCNSLFLVGRAQSTMISIEEQFNGKHTISRRTLLQIGGISERWLPRPSVGSRSLSMPLPASSSSVFWTSAGASPGYAGVLRT